MLNEKCGIFGIYGEGMDVARLTFFGLFALQHRGQESSGIAAADGKTINCYKNVGLVTQVYTEATMEPLKGHIAIGHNRYSTSKDTGLIHAQPVLNKNQRVALAHNGNLPSTAALEQFLQKQGRATAGLNDSEAMAEAIDCRMENGLSVAEAVKKSYALFTGAFCLTILTRDTLVAVRDSFGIRPLSLARLNGGYVVASETCAFHPIGAELIREIKPGEMVVINNEGLQSVQLVPGTQKLDLFEFVYFSRPDSVMLGKSVYEVRRNCGMRLAREYPVKADLVLPVPETGVPVAIGYSQALGLPLEMALVKNRYIHRTFIQPEQHSRDLGVKLKLTPLPEVLRGKKIVLIDDSIVRGTTARQIVAALFEAGAKEVHFLVSSPPVKFPDFYGIDTPNQKNLIAAQKSVPEIEKYLGATSLYYLSLEGLIASTGLPKEVFNTSCFTGEYPIDIAERIKEVVYA